jgi:hypothetical protein
MALSVVNYLAWLIRTVAKRYEADILVPGHVALGFDAPDSSDVSQGNPEAPSFSWLPPTAW